MLSALTEGSPCGVMRGDCALANSGSAATNANVRRSSSMIVGGEARMMQPCPRPNKWGRSRAQPRGSAGVIGRVLRDVPGGQIAAVRRRRFTPHAEIDDEIHRVRRQRLARALIVEVEPCSLLHDLEAVHRR